MSDTRVYIQLKEIYRSIEDELNAVTQALKVSLSKTRNKSILKMNQFLLQAPSKRLRPALVILSAKATSNHKSEEGSRKLINIASAIELIHTASLIHDDVLDHAVLRHNRSSINSKWGSDISIALGDYLYSRAFELISSCNNMDILSCISQATSLMCEGELVQVCERNNISLLRQRYFFIVKKKTASLFAASCESGATLSGCPKLIQSALRRYGLNLGIAFQITDDCLDLIGEQKDLGKTPGADFKVGELTLPLLNLLSQTSDRNRLISLIKGRGGQATFKEIKKRFIDSSAFLKTKEDVFSYIQKARVNLNGLSDSCFKQSLCALTDYVAQRINVIK